MAEAFPFSVFLLSGMWRRWSWRQNSHVAIMKPGAEEPSFLTAKLEEGGKEALWSSVPEWCSPSCSNLSKWVLCCVEQKHSEENLYMSKCKLLLLLPQGGDPCFLNSFLLLSVCFCQVITFDKLMKPITNLLLPLCIGWMAIQNFVFNWFTTFSQDDRKFFSMLMASYVSSLPNPATCALWLSPILIQVSLLV